VDEEEDEIKIAYFPLLKATQPKERIEYRTPLNIVPDIPEFMQKSLNIRYSESREPSYEPPKHRGRDANCHHYARNATYEVTCNSKHTTVT